MILRKESRDIMKIGIEVSFTNNSKIKNSMIQEPKQINTSELNPTQIESPEK